MLDEGLDLVTALWSGAPVHHAGEHYRVDGVRFEPTPVQRPLPVWAAAIWPSRRPLQRAARWHGVFPLGLPGPGAVAEITRVVGRGKDIAVPADQHPAREWDKAGATWWLQRVPPDRPASDPEALIDAGPPRQ